MSALCEHECVCVRETACESNTCKSLTTSYERCVCCRPWLNGGTSCIRTTTADADTTIHRMQAESEHVVMLSMRRTCVEMSPITACVVTFGLHRAEHKSEARYGGVCVTYYMVSVLMPLVLLKSPARMLVSVTTAL